MEVEELKKVWASVDERLKKQEIIKERIVWEMIHEKANRSLGKLFWADSIGIMVLLLIIPLLVNGYKKNGGKLIIGDLTIIDLTIIFTVVFFIIYLPFLVYRVYELMKIDLSGSLVSNLNFVKHYYIRVIWEKKIMISLGPVFFILVSIMLIEANADISRWILWICMYILAILYGYWSYNKFYNKNIKSIKKSLEEMEELKNELL